MNDPFPRILFEDEFLLIVDKPARLHSVENKASLEPSLATLLKTRSDLFTLASPREEDGGLVHRLDRDTSGIIVAAKTRDVWNALHQAFLSGEITKSYLLICEGILPLEIQTESYLGNPNRGAKKVRVYTAPPRAKERALQALTQFSQLTLFDQKNASLARAFAPTARRHQIRAHAASLGYPLVGDALYGSTRALTEVVPTLTLRDFFLHADTISFKHPHTEEIISVVAPYSL